MNNLDILSKKISEKRSVWLITGVAGFIGSNILEYLLQNNQKVIGIDNFATGHKSNLDLVKNEVGDNAYKNFIFHNLDITKLNYKDFLDYEVDYILHQAALGSVPRSIENPKNTNEANIVGFLNMIQAAKNLGVKNFVYAGSSSTYGDHSMLPKVEEVIGKPLSPYAVTKYVNELYADVFYKVYGFRSSGLRYFNVFGKRQDPNGAYAAVIPKWIKAMLNNQTVSIYGDGKTSRDFCFIENVIQANILAAIDIKNKGSNIYNVAFGERTSLNELFLLLKDNLKSHNIIYEKEPIYESFRSGDVRHSLASITKISSNLGYSPYYDISNGIKKSIGWYVDSVKKNDSQ